MGDVFEGIMLLGKILEILEKRALCCCKNVFEKCNFSQFSPQHSTCIVSNENLKNVSSRVQGWGGTDSVPGEIQYTVQKRKS